MEIMRQSSQRRRVEGCETLDFSISYDENVRFPTKVDSILKRFLPAQLTSDLMSIPMSAAEVLEREFLEMRAKLLELAASMDRLDRAAGDVEEDERLSDIHEGLRILREEKDRAEQIQLLFSLNYDDQWQERFQLPPR